jgi:hypothetical protein
MAEVSLEVPAPVVPAVRESVVLLYRATAEALQLSLDAQARGEASLREVRRHRVRFEQLGRALDQLGWPGDDSRGDEGAIELSGASEVVHDAIQGALIDTGERLAVACSAGWRGESTEVSVRELGAEVIMLDRLARQTEPGSSRGGGG